MRHFKLNQTPALSIQTKKYSVSHLSYSFHRSQCSAPQIYQPFASRANGLVTKGKRGVRQRFKDWREWHMQTSAGFFRMMLVCKPGLPEFGAEAEELAVFLYSALGTVTISSSSCCCFVKLLSFSYMVDKDFSPQQQACFKNTHNPR